MSARIAGAVDFGGTKLMIGLVDETGAILDRQTVVTPRDAGPPAVAQEAARALRAQLDKRGMRASDLVGVGSTVPALADSARGILLYAPAHGWRDVAFAQMLEAEVGVRARIANDVNACVLAEARFGVGRDVRTMVWITVSTGVGSGLLLDGRLYEGSRALAGEIGHIVVDEKGATCGCGNRGCLEAMAAGPAIAKRARAAGLDAIDARAVAELAKRDDPVAKQVMEDTAVYLGRGIAACINVLDPELVVLGGGVAQSLDLLRPTIERTIRERVIMPEARGTRIEPSALGYECALIGAATLVL